MQLLHQQILFKAGVDGYARYRIPALCAGADGTILAFCEARKYTGRDADQIDLIVRRSHDFGRSFDPPAVVRSEPGRACGNPAPVLDRATGTLWLLFTRNDQDAEESLIRAGEAQRSIWLTSSRDSGASWDDPVDITTQIKPDHWSWYATGPGHGIQLRSGRLMIPCDHVVAEAHHRFDSTYSHVVYSDDHGASWEIGGSAEEGTNESTLVEATDGRLCLNCRNKPTRQLDGGGNYRAVAWSGDGGATFGPIVHDAALPEPICQASLCRCDAVGRPAVLFSNPGRLDARADMTVRASYDECQTWPVMRVIHRGPAAYSDLCPVGAGSALCYFEAGLDGPYERLVLARFNLEWLTHGVDPVSSARVSSARV